MPCRSGSPQGVVSAAAGAEAAGAWADAPVMGTETTAPMAVPAMATVIIEPESLSRMMASFCLAVPDCNGIPVKSEQARIVAFFGIRR
jgi:hypothetical protein